MATTSGFIAMLDLETRIEGYQGRPGEDARDAAAWIELIVLRCQLRGSIADAETAAARAEALGCEHPGNGAALLVRARTRALFHRFEPALDDLDRAARNGVDAPALDEVRAGIFETAGRLDEALRLREETARRLPTLASLGALAVVHARRRDYTRAERLYQQSRAQPHDGSPIPLARLDLARGRSWFAQGELRRAQGWFAAALQRLPAYAPAAGWLAETDAQMGDVEAAIARLRPLAELSDHPTFAVRLAHVLGTAGLVDEAAHWRDRAARRYRELAAAHAEAFAYRAAVFERSSPGGISSQGSPPDGGAGTAPGWSTQAESAAP
jgi:tetratricopeptide (TPR) repeat protein